MPLRSTSSALILYLGDKGFMFGEHGLIDKRTAYEAAMRIPIIARCPALFPPNSHVDQIVAHVDVAPTMLAAAAGLAAPAVMAAANMVPFARGPVADWRTELLYEYYWERNFPQTPTVRALGGDRYEYALPRPLGPGRAVRPGGRPAGERQSARSARSRDARRAAERALVRPARPHRRDGDPAEPRRGYRFLRRDPNGPPQAPFPQRFFDPNYD